MKAHSFIHHHERENINNIKQEDDWFFSIFYQQQHAGGRDDFFCLFQNCRHAIWRIGLYLERMDSILIKSFRQWRKDFSLGSQQIFHHCVLRCRVSRIKAGCHDRRRRPSSSATTTVFASMCLSCGWFCLLGSLWCRGFFFLTFPGSDFGAQSMRHFITGEDIGNFRPGSILVFEKSSIRSMDASDNFFCQIHLFLLACDRIISFGIGVEHYLEATVPSVTGTNPWLPTQNIKLGRYDAAMGAREFLSY